MRRLFKTLRFFFDRNPTETSLVVALLILAAILEALGVSMFLPFLKLFLEGREIIEFPNGAVNAFLANNGIVLNYQITGLFIIAMLTLKALVLWFVMKRVSTVVAASAGKFRENFLNAIVNSKWQYLTRNSTGESMNTLAVEPIRAAAAFMSATRMIVSFMQFGIYILASSICIMGTHSSYYFRRVDYHTGTASIYCVGKARRQSTNKRI